LKKNRDPNLKNGVHKDDNNIDERNRDGGRKVFNNRDGETITVDTNNSEAITNKKKTFVEEKEQGNFPGLDEEVDDELISTLDLIKPENGDADDVALPDSANDHSSEEKSRKAAPGPTTKEEKMSEFLKQQDVEFDVDEVMSIVQNGNFEARPDIQSMLMEAAYKSSEMQKIWEKIEAEALGLDGDNDVEGTDLK